MSELLAFYQQQASANQSNIPWLQRLQHDALANFSRLGFPARQDEDWKYSPPDAFKQQAFSSACGDNTPHTTSLSPVPMGIPLVLNNGVATKTEALIDKLPPGVIVEPLMQAMTLHEDKIKPYLNQILQQEHGFSALNTAMIQDGLFIYLPKGAKVDQPLILTHWHDTPMKASYIRHLVIAEEGSAINLIEDYQGDAQTPYFTNTITEIHLAAQAQVTHYKIQRESKLAYHVGQLAVAQDKASQFISHSLSLGGKWVRSDIQIKLQGPHAACQMNGIYTTREGQHIDHHTLVNHDVPNCQSAQDYKGILSGRSRAVFNGRIVVAKQAIHTAATQQNKNLLLSADAEIDTKPQLEIFADDVVCTHGATVGQLDAEALFYLATRGIGRAEAMRYLVLAFAADNLRTVALPELADWMGLLLNQQLG